MSDKVIYASSSSEGRESAALLYSKVFGHTPSVAALDGAGSDRKYFRVTAPGGPSVVATWGENRVENKCFTGLARAFASSGIPVPQVFATDDDFTTYLQEDLGDEQLLEHLGGPDRMKLAEECLDKLAEMQTVDEAVWSPWVMSPEFSRRQVMWDLNYFKYEFLKPCAIVFDEERLENDFDALSRRLTSWPDSLKGFMYRDFQSRNIMITPGGLRFIDFQGGRKGPLLYDAISFLWQVKAGFNKEERETLLRYYAGHLSALRGVEVSRVLEDVGVVVLFRTLQVLGAYGFRGLVEKRAHFIESIPGALRNMAELIDSGVADPYPELKGAALKAIGSRFGKTDSGDGLTVKVFSFSYKRGYPEDLSGNGGGFMFDCRGMHNPGRYEEYKRLTGLDAPVVAFLEEKGEVGEFVENALRIVMPVVARYLSRGFRNLQVGFGCTGGRHRSVYCAQRFAEKLASEYPEARVSLRHREQMLSQEFNAEAGEDVSKN